MVPATVVPDPDRDLLSTSFIGGGVAPLRSGSLPLVVHQWVDGSDTVKTVYHQGYLFTGDRARGFDVLAFQ